MKNTSLRLWRRKSVVVALACILLLASGLGYLYYAGILRVEIPKVKKDVVGVIRVEGPILFSRNASQYSDVINRAMINETVKAVVLVVDSPGGYADLIEQIYLDLVELKEEKPLVASVVSALSGGYYISVAADYIYVCPTSMVGNVGVIGVAPPTLIPSEWVLETGAYKVTGFSKLLFPYNLSRALDSFASAVESGRGDRLKLSPTELRRGMVYMGSEAITVGLADEIGSLQKAIGRVAQEAGLVEYEVVDLTQVSETRMSSSDHTSGGWGNLTMEALNRLHPPPAIYYLYLPPGAFTQGLSSIEPRAGNLTADMSVGKGEGGVVLVDSSHGNKVSWWELDILVWELVKRNMTVRFVSEWDELEPALNNASALIVASPTEPYSTEESERIEDFVDDGRMLLLFFDPTAEYVEIPALFGPINSLSTRFGLSFAKGYLYNEEEHYGIYRNIYVRRFANSPLTQNLTSLVLFTATHIYSLDKGVAWASEGTYSSSAERTDKYPVIALVKDNGTVAAFGDLTFLREPYCYLEDNYNLILNMASAIAGVEVLPAPPAPPAPEEEITRPDLPVGTEKNFTERVNGEERLLRWLKVSELEVRVERPDRTTHYYYDEEGSLLRWVSNGMEAVYEPPIPEEPYPLTKGESWEYESNYTLIMEGEEHPGRLVGEEEVVGFEDVTAEDGESYLCAKVRYRLVDQLMKDGTNITIVTTGHSWISTQAGLVKEESTSQYYVDGVFAGEEKRGLLLKSIKKG